MCGIVGVIPGKNLSKAHSDKLVAYLTQAILADSVRGYHSTGIMALPRDVELDGGLVTYKEALPGYTFVDTKGYRNIVADLSDYKFLVAHNRWATRGAVNYDNSHPFVHGNIAMVHNGTLRSRSTLPKGSKFAVDSEDVCYNMDAAGVMATLENIDGAFAIAAIDTEKRTLLLTRNNERDLHFAFCKDIDATLIASEDGMLSWLAARNGIELKELYEVSAGTLITFDGDARDYEAVEVPLYVPPKKSEVSDSYQRNRGGYQITATTKKVFDTLGVTEHTTFGFHIYEYRPYKTSTGNNTGWGKLVGYLISPEVNQYVEVQIAGCTDAQEAERLENPDLIFEGTSIYANTIEVTGLSIPVIHITPASVTRTKFTTAQAEAYVKQAKEVDDVLLGPGGTVVTRAEWDKLTEKGCTLCGSALSVIQADFLDWHEGEPICPRCAYELDEDDEDDEMMEAV